MDTKPQTQVTVRDWMREAGWWPLFRWAAGLWLASAVMGLFIGNTVVIPVQPWLWLVGPMLAVSVVVLSCLVTPGVLERPWPRWALWLLAACALGIAVYLVLAAWLSWQHPLPWQALRHGLLALAVLPISLIGRRLARLQALSFSNKDTP